MLVRMSQTSAAERARLTSAAHAAIRGARKSDDVRRRMAESKSRLRGAGEFVLLAHLRSLGHLPEEQAPIDSYNVDLLVGSVAVEPRCSSGNPMRRPEIKQRTEHLLRRGVSSLWVIYVELDALRGCLDEVVTHLDEMSRDPAPSGQHRVIRCAAHRFTRVRNELGQLTAVPAPIRYECRRVE